MPRLSIPSCLCLALVAMAVVSSTASRTLNQESTLQRCLSAFQAAGGESTLRSNLGSCSSAADLSNGNCCAAVSADSCCVSSPHAQEDIIEQGAGAVQFSPVHAHAHAREVVGMGSCHNACMHACLR
jgi:hypothetical protein